MKEIPLTRGLVALVDDEDYETISKFKWHVHETGYALRKVKHPIKGTWTHISMHRQILGIEFGDRRDIDHIDGNRRNNTRLNLRICSRAENQYNRGANSNNTSGYKGVYWKHDRKKWGACIRANDKRKYLGYFPTPEEAYAAYCKAASELHGEFANHG